MSGLLNLSFFPRLGSPFIFVIHNTAAEIVCEIFHWRIINTWGLWHHIKTTLHERRMEDELVHNDGFGVSMDFSDFFRYNLNQWDYCMLSGLSYYLCWYFLRVNISFEEVNVMFLLLKIIFAFLWRAYHYNPLFIKPLTDPSFSFFVFHRNLRAWALSWGTRRWFPSAL